MNLSNSSNFLKHNGFFFQLFSILWFEKETKISFFFLTLIKTFKFCTKQSKLKQTYLIVWIKEKVWYKILPCWRLIIFTQLNISFWLKSTIKERIFFSHCASCQFESFQQICSVQGSFWHNFVPQHCYFRLFSSDLVWKSGGARGIFKFISKLSKLWNELNLMKKNFNEQKHKLFIKISFFNKFERILIHQFCQCSGVVHFLDVCPATNEDSIDEDSRDTFSPSHGSENVLNLVTVGTILQLDSKKLYVEFPKLLRKQQKLLQNLSINKSFSLL